MTEQEVIRAISTKTPKQLEQWLMNLSDDDAIEASRILTELVKKNPQYENDKELQDELANAQIATHQFEEIVIEEKVQNLMYEVELEAKTKERDEAYAEVRTAIKAELINNPKDEDLKRAVTELRQIEIETDFYEKANWEDVEHLL